MRAGLTVRNYGFFLDQTLHNTPCAGRWMRTVVRLRVLSCCFCGRVPDAQAAAVDSWLGAPLHHLYGQVDCGSLTATVRDSSRLVRPVSPRSGFTISLASPAILSVNEVS